MTENLLRQAIPVFINSFNQPSYLKSTVYWFHRHGFHNVTVLDNASESPELLEYFSSRKFLTKARLHSLGENIGPRNAVIVAQTLLGPNAPFIFTDPDLALPRRPAPDFLTHMFELGLRYERLKVGLALDITDNGTFKDIKLKRFNRTVPIQQWEKRFWRNKLEPNVYSASVDTTFFLHVPVPNAKVPLAKYGRFQPRIPALRVAGRGFLAQHKPWYLDDGQSEEERAYYLQKTSKVATWVQDELDEKENPAPETGTG